MKVTRLQKGYKIRLTDLEFAALDFLYMHGHADMQGIEGDDITTQTTGKLVRAVRRLCNQHDGCIMVTDDRRTKAPDENPN